MARGRPPDLTDDENARVRAAVRRIVAKEGSQTAAADRLGVAMSMVHALLREESGASFRFARRVAEIEGVSVVKLLQLK